MNQQTEDNKTLAMDLYHLMTPGRSRSKHFWKHLDECYEFVDECTEHPFGLKVPDSEIGLRRQIKFAGLGNKCSVDMTVQVFLANVHFWVGSYDGGEVTALRVINMPFQMPFQQKERGGQHYVFFEVQTDSINIISGETTDFSGAGNAGRQALESVFAVLSKVYGVEIERVTVEPIPLRDLYRKYAAV
jgi:hypothetical protein